MKQTVINTFLFILLLLAFGKPIKAADSFVFAGMITLEGNNAPISNYSVLFMVNNDSLNCFQSITNDNGSYSETLWLDQNDSLTVFVYDCNGLKHEHLFTTYDSLNIADFSICDERSNCIALFVAEPDPINPLAYNFINLSIGDFNFAFWDFDDGTTSNEINPYHIFPQKGTYMVSLLIMDTIMPDGCINYLKKPVFVGGSDEFVADFSFSLDTINNTPMVYRFNNESVGSNLKYSWDFGDGAYSEEQNPVHTYLNGGEYQVDLMIVDSITQYFAETEQTLTTPEYYSFGGQVFLGDYPINVNPEDHENSATAYLYRKIENRWHYMDKREFWKLGYYWFTDKLEGDYLIKVVLDDGSEAYNHYAPGYYKHAAIWKNASVFSLEQEVFEESISLVELAEINDGMNQIEGSVVYNGSRQVMNGVLVQLYNDEGEIVKYTYSDGQGRYVFSNLPDGSYSIRGEVVGFCSSKIKVDLSSRNGSTENTDVVIFDCGAIGIDEEQDVQSIYTMELYPVPANKYLNISLGSPDKIKGKLSIINVEGVTVFNRLLNVPHNEPIRIKINISNLQGGIYLVVLYDDSLNPIVSKKIVISH